jgi:cell division protein FtsB
MAAAPESKTGRGAGRPAGFGGATALGGSARGATAGGGSAVGGSAAARRRTVAGIVRPRLTGRGMLVAAMALFLVVILASPFQTYLNRRASVASSERQQQQLNARVAQLQHETEQWNDPAFLERQARVRLQYIRPGDTLYTVLDANGNPLSPPASAATEKVTRTGSRPSWNTTLWASVHEADTVK